VRDSTPRAELTAFCEQLRRAAIRPERLLLFGSWARGEQREDSEIDPIVVSRDFAQLDDFRRPRKRLASRLGPPRSLSRRLDARPRRVSLGGEGWCSGRTYRGLSRFFSRVFLPPPRSSNSSPLRPDDVTLEPQQEPFYCSHSREKLMPRRRLRVNMDEIPDAMSASETDPIQT
jgi:predicted nucleotidyltransferase